MLQSLHVKNLALMEETEVEFTSGLNILTGETGAGKSLLIDSLNLALGAKFEKDMLRTGAESALVELVFEQKGKAVLAKLDELGVDAEDDQIIISRKMQPGKSVFKINGETVTARQIKDLASVLIDTHGQHEHESLLHKKKHREILDAYCGNAIAEELSRVGTLYSEWKELEEALHSERMDEGAQLRERSLAEFELKEIEDAKLVEGEDEELEQLYRRMSNAQRIEEGLAECYRYSGSDSSDGAGAMLGRAIRALGEVSMYDERLQELEKEVLQAEEILADFNRELAGYMADSEFDQESFAQVEERLNRINHLKGKYGRTIPEILAYGRNRQEVLNRLADYDSYISELEKKLEKVKEELMDACEKASVIRREQALLLKERLVEALSQLNFLSLDFDIAVTSNGTVTALGYDDVEFLISTNPGENLKPLHQVASGGELSRVMLGIKTVLAGKDETDTLIFDEIDAGISGRTAWKVAGQLNVAGKSHQVICITHLPQIAAMADSHFVICKSSTDNRTITDVTRITADDQLKELARMLGSDELTEAALSNAEELRNQALKVKE